MAVTKIKPIRGTVNKALAYILDPQKTDDALYVSSYGCAASDAAAKEFEWTRNLAVQQGMQMPKVIARHLIQSFDVGEVTPEQAHEIGKQFADEWLKGKYEYVIATHIDKGHCHNHIIFNAVNYVDFHAYRSNKCILRRSTAAGAVPAVAKRRQRSVVSIGCLRLNHHSVVLGCALQNCVGRDLVVHNHGGPTARIAL